ncbi:2389_t:CDS:2 [Dentiscutata heterogama]|uniref:2389_t:CDS:1 n=1 Tax=Dentiscutata heterogama TaxID=1316150 RepID=A0ACA9JYZ8_9GLOM|nr:2389_t:CDS:2 [Dentiscutata heterogama]
MDNDNANREQQNNQNAEFVENIIEGINPFATTQNAGAPQQTPSLSEMGIDAG